MGKKSKKKNIWDFTAEDQMKASKKMWEELDVDDIFSNPKKKKDKSDSDNVGGTLGIPPKTIRKEINVLREGQKIHNSESCGIYPGEMESILLDSMGSLARNPGVSVPTINTTESNFGIRVKNYKQLQRLTIDDGVSPVTVSYKLIQEFPQELVLGELTEDEENNMISKMLLYIITRKHPVCVMNWEEFNKYFNHIKSYDTLKFLIFDVDDYALLYYIDLDNDGDNPILTIGDEIANEDMSIFLNYMAHVAFTTGYISSCFYIEDNEYIEKYKEFSNGNIEKYMNLLKNDEATVMIEEDTNPLQVVEMYDAEEICCEAREILDRISPEDDDEACDYCESDTDNDLLSGERSDNNENKEEDLGEQLMKGMEQFVTPSTVSSPQATQQQSVGQKKLIPNNSVQNQQTQQQSMTLPVIRKNN